METLRDDTYFMELALGQAQEALDKNEVPIGAVMASENLVISKGHNQVETLQDVTAHAEMLCLTSAFNYFNTKYLEGCTMYVTVEPCLMCATAIRLSRLSKLVIGCREPKSGFSQFDMDFFRPKIEVDFGIEEERASVLMKQFFRTKRI